MTAKELIAKLTELGDKYGMDTTIVVRGYEGGVNTVREVDLIAIGVNAYKDRHYTYYGDHVELQDHLWDNESVLDEVTGEIRQAFKLI